MDVYQLKFTQIKSLTSVNYVNEDIVIINNVEELLGGYKAIRADVFLNIVCIQGKFQCYFDTELCTLQANNMLLYHPGASLSDIVLSPDLECKILCLSCSAIQEHVRIDREIWEKAFYISRHPIIYIKEERIRLLKLYCDLIDYRIQLTERSYHDEVLGALTHAIIYEIFADLSDFIVASSNEQIRQSDILFKKFIGLLSSGPIKQRSVAFYADNLCVTPKYLSAVCKQTSGRGALEWINHYMVVNIKYLLKYSNKSIGEISEELDFPNPSFFGKYTKHHLGASPKEYRRLLSQRKNE